MEADPVDQTGETGRTLIDFQAIAADPRPGMRAPNLICFSPDDDLIAFVLAEPGASKLLLLAWEIDAASGCAALPKPLVRPGDFLDGPGGASAGDSDLPPAAPAGGAGINAFSFGAVRGRGSARATLLFQAGGSLYLQAGAGAQPRLLVDARTSHAGLAGGPIVEPRLSPDEMLVAYVRGGEVHVLRLPSTDPSPSPSPPGAPAADGQPCASAPLSPRRVAAAPSLRRACSLPHGGRPAAAAAGEGPRVGSVLRRYSTCPARLSHSLSEFVEKEQLDTFDGYWWSADSQWIAFQETDESSIPPFLIANHACGPHDPSALEAIRYPFAGGNNAVVRVGVLAAQGSAQPPLWLDLGVEWVRRQAAPAATRSGPVQAEGAPVGCAVGCGQAAQASGGGPSASARQEAAATEPGRREAKARVATDPPPRGQQPCRAPYGSSGRERFADGYLTAVCWGRRGSLYVQVQDRSQRELRLLRFAPPGGTECGWRAAAPGGPPLLGTLVLHETSPCWVGLHSCFRELDDGALLWASARSGFLHLYRHAPSGACEGALTAGEWVVDSVEAVDETASLVYFTGSLGDAAQRNLFCAPLRCRAVGAVPRRLTPEDGWHVVEVAHARAVFVDVFSALGKPHVVTLCRLADGSQLARLFESEDPRAGPSLPCPELATIRSAQGDELHAVIYHPPSRFARPRPLIVSAYGGPEKQTTTNSWALNAAMREQYYAQEGFVVLRLDNRGSARRGAAFEQALHGQLGAVEVADQVAGVEALVARGLVDASKVGMIGWSYGGYLSLLCLAQAPATFCAACCGAPVATWEGYASYYTERYLGLPDEQPAGYAASAALSYVPRIADSARLLLVHGLLDENVHFRHTALLVQALTAHGKRHELLALPTSRHVPSRHDYRVYVEERIAEFFRSALGGGGGAGAMDGAGDDVNDDG